MLLAIIGICQPFSAIACDTSPACIADIDSFFLPLIANSLMDRPQTGAATGPVVAPDTELPADIVVIRPPPRPAAPPAADRMPARRIKLVQRIAAGQITEGGAASLTVHDDAAWLPALADGNSASSDLTIPALRPTDAASGIWRMEHAILLPMQAAWPIGRIEQDVGMWMTCGGCAKNGGVAQFRGVARFGMEFDQFAEGGINDIDLTSADGMQARGQLTFWDDQPARHLVRDSEASLILWLDGQESKMTADLAGWLNEDRHVGGVFSAVPIDDGTGFGGIAGQFSGDVCPPACGVEN